MINSFLIINCVLMSQSPLNLSQAITKLNNLVQPHLNYIIDNSYLLGQLRLLINYIFIIIARQVTNSMWNDQHLSSHSTSNQILH